MLVSGWLLPEKPDTPDLKSENLKSEFDGCEAGVLPTHPIQISHFRIQISSLKLRQSEICHSGIDILHSNVMLYYFKVCVTTKIALWHSERFRLMRKPSGRKWLGGRRGGREREGANDFSNN